MSWTLSKQELPVPAHPPFISAHRVLFPGSLWVTTSCVPHLKTLSSLRSWCLAWAEECNGMGMSQPGTSKDLFVCLVNTQGIYPQCRTGDE